MFWILSSFQHVSIMHFFRGLQTQTTDLYFQTQIWVQGFSFRFTAETYFLLLFILYVLSQPWFVHRGQDCKTFSFFLTPSWGWNCYLLDIRHPQEFLSRYFVCKYFSHLRFKMSPLNYCCCGCFWLMGARCEDDSSPDPRRPPQNLFRLRPGSHFFFFFFFRLHRKPTPTQPRPVVP